MRSILQLIKKLSATPILSAQTGHGEHIDSQAALQANKATFFFQLVRPQNCDVL